MQQPWPTWQGSEFCPLWRHSELAYVFSVECGVKNVVDLDVIVITGCTQVKGHNGGGANIGVKRTRSEKERKKWNTEEIPEEACLYIF